LARFDRLERLRPDQLSKLTGQVEIFEVREGTAFVELGSQDPHAIFLLDGNVRLEAQDGAIRFLNQADPAARKPLCRLRPTRYRALAASQVQFLRISDTLLERVLDQDVGNDAYAVQDHAEVGVAVAQAPEEELLLEFFDDLKNKRAVVLTPPRVAHGVCRRITAAAGEASQIAEALHLDPVLALKIIHAANSRSPSNVPVRSVRAAVERLGVASVSDLVLQCAWLETFRPPTQLLHERVEQWWRESLLTASLSHLLAGMAGGLNSGFANLVGLSQNIGEAVLLGYALRDERMAESRALLDRFVGRYAATVGRMLLGRWSVPTELALAAANTTNWFRESAAGEPDYVDIALIAQYLARLPRSLEARGVLALPKARELPSVQRLGDWYFVEDFGRHALGIARKAVAKIQYQLAA
jgi:HD-like signal output (HDOD) protein